MIKQKKLQIRIRHIPSRKGGNVPFSYPSGYRQLFSVRISTKTYLFIK
ncbi:hypothetical protein HMPREF9442_00139 [Paraprevotella xylaniphila YIT 11841]|uniref:Uncharacterized protein n=1 Tax=Paraprevotella xylaniphila YIT 11841 TaxID=762982 RepID=F3QPQ2_9BACT|nr:hypothetical protein HMPREF9442_00139 [Paraprevotella xylaniphila YIT 11841]